MTADVEVINWITEQMQAVVGEGEFDINPSGEPSRFPAIYIEETDQSADDGTEPGATRYELPIPIEGYVEGSDGMDATLARRALYNAVVDALLDVEQWPACVEEIHEGEMRMATTVLAEKRRLGFSLTVTIHFVAPR